MIKHTLNILKILFLGICVSLPVQLIGYLVVPLVLLGKLSDRRTTGDLKDQRLPKWAKWWDVGDEYDIQYGLNGDLGYQANNNINTDSSRLKIYWCRLKWLAFRNPANYFKYHILGAKADANVMINHISPTPTIEIGDWSNEGWRIVETSIGNEYYIVKRYKRWPNKCFRARLGLKLGHQGEALNERTQISFVCSIIPVKTYRGV